MAATEGRNPEDGVTEAEGGETRTPHFVSKAPRIDDTGPRTTTRVILPSRPLACVLGPFSCVLEGYEGVGEKERWQRGPPGWWSAKVRMGPRLRGVGTLRVVCPGGGESCKAYL